MDENFQSKGMMPVKRPFFWLMVILTLLFALGFWLMVLGLRTAPFALPGAASM